MEVGICSPSETDHEANGLSMEEARRMMILMESVSQQIIWRKEKENSLEGCRK